MNSKSSLALALVAALNLCAATDALARNKKAARKASAKPPVEQIVSYAGRAEAIAFAEEMSGRGLDAAWIQETLNQANKLEAVRKAIQPFAAGQRKNWQAYHDRFVESARTGAGMEFLQQHRDALTRASTQYGVPTEVILGILGVETFYGRDTGRFRVVDSLATLAFDYPVINGKDRSPYFREQLAQFFIWCQKEQCDPFNIKGSYAGAMGLPQFMPENIHRFGIDFDGNGHINLNDPVDAIGSVARFLALHGWINQLSPIASVDLANAQMTPLLAPDIIPTFTPAELASYGAKPLEPILDSEKYALVELQNGEAVSDYVLGSRNFFALTRYNRSSYYAMAVLALGRQVVSQVREESMASAASVPEQSDGAAAPACVDCYSNSIQPR